MIGLIISVFIVGFLILFSGNIIRPKFYSFMALIPLSLFVFFCSFIFPVIWGQNLSFSYPWIPSLGVNFDFKIDGLSLLFALLITGIGSLVYFYASYYVKQSPYLNRFFSYLTLFMGAMLGLVLSDNLITIFMFWELTSITSFFLIGFNNEDEKSRKSAITALAITGLGGFLLLAGFLIIANVTGSFSVQELISSSEILQNHALYPLMIALIFAGAFTKSAQFPFHYWLPGAMQAPTPVSAYLHSATMVKAGIYILARLSPSLSDGFLWNNTLMLFGGITMIYGAYHSIYRSDMKSVLAYSTISALGIIVFLLGLGNEYAIYAAVTFILVHALYKAALFLVTGIVDHTLHSRDLNEVYGLRKLMPLVAIASLIAALSSAGVPLTFGFLSKDLIYESTLNAGQYSFWLCMLAVLTNTFLACSGFMVGLQPFMGKRPAEEQKLIKPSVYLWLPVVVLSSLSLFFGIFPMIADKGILAFAYQAIRPGETELYLKIWHGFNLVLLLSVVTIVSGFVLFLMRHQVRKLSQPMMKLEVASPQNIMEGLAENFRKFAFLYTRFFHNGYLRNYLIMIILFITLLVGYRLFTTMPIGVNTEELTDLRLYELIIFIIIVIAIFLTLRTPSRLTAILSTGVIGYGICLIFVFYGAPDLAMTQFTIDTLTVVLFVLVLFKLPPFLKFKNKRIRWRDGIIASSFGALIMLITLQALLSPADMEVSQYYADNAYVLAKGKNVVNVILVDFRGFDTMVETIVLSIAALGVYGLLKYKGINEETD